MEYDFLSLFKQVCYIERWRSQDAYGQANYENPYSVACRTVHKTRMVRNAKGEEVISTATTWIPPNDVTIKDRITLPDESRPQILQVASLPDESGLIHHQIIYT